MALLWVCSSALALGSFLHGEGSFMRWQQLVEHVVKDDVTIHLCLKSILTYASAPASVPALLCLPQAPDLPQIAFRQLRQEWIDMGYGYPPESELPRRGLLPRDC